MGHPVLYISTWKKLASPRYDGSFIIEVALLDRKNSMTHHFCRCDIFAPFAIVKVFGQLEKKQFSTSCQNLCNSIAIPNDIRYVFVVLVIVLGPQDNLLGSCAIIYSLSFMQPLKDGIRFISETDKSNLPTFSPT